MLLSIFIHNSIIQHQNPHQRLSQRRRTAPLRWRERVRNHIWSSRAVKLEADWLRSMLERHFLPAVISTALDLVDLSEPCERRWSWDRRSPRSTFKNSLRRKKTDETELIQVEAEQLSPVHLNPERASLDSSKCRIFYWSLLLLYYFSVFQSC